MPRRSIGFALVLSFAAGAACGTSDVPSCELVGAKFVALAQRDITTTKIEPELRRLLLDQIPAARDCLVNACKDSAWTGSLRRCLLDAPDHVAFGDCQRPALTAEQRDALQRCNEPND